MRKAAQTSHPVPENEAERLALLHSLRVLGRGPEKPLESLCNIARALFGVPIAHVSLVDEDRQWFQAKCGIEIDGTPRDVAFCAYTILGDAIFEVPDATGDPRFDSLPMVTGAPGIRFYAGAPLVFGEGLRLGAICIADTRPRALSPEQHVQLRELADIAVAHLRQERLRVELEEEAELRRASEALVARQREDLDRYAAEVARREELLSTTLEHMDQGLMMIDATGTVQVCNQRAVRLLDLPAELMARRPSFEDVREYQLSRGEFTRAGDRFATWVRGGGLERTEHCYERERPDGRVLEIRTVPLEGGGAVRTYTDITERRRAAEALHETTALLNATLDNMDQGLFMVDGDGIVQVCNEQAIRLLGLPAEMMRRKPHFSEIIAFQNTSGEFAGAVEGREAWLKLKRDLLGAPPVYERQRPNGTTLEVRTVKLADGGAVRTFTDLTDRKAHEVALAKSEARYRTLAHALPQMVWVMQVSDGRAIYTNQSFQDFYGPIGDDRRERTSRNHPDDAERVERLWQAAAESGEPFQAEVRLRRHDGAYRWHKLVMNPIRRDDEVVEWLGTALDIDDIVRDQEALRETTAMIRLAQEGANAGLFDWEAEHGGVRLSAESLRQLGFPGESERVVPMDELRRVIDPDHLAQVRAAVFRSAASGRPFRAEYRVTHPDRSVHWLLGIGRVMPGADGKPRRVVGLQLDITERRQAEENLRQREQQLRTSEERLALALESSAGALWDWDVPSGRLWVNEGWYRMLGREPGRLDTHLSVWNRLVHPEDLKGVLERLNDHLHGRTPVYEAEYRVAHADGSWVWTLDRGRAVTRSSTGTATRMIGVRIDITPRKIAESRAEHRAHHDVLTDLPNRVLFHERITRQLGGKTPSSSFALLLLDLDRFKLVNDTFGHMVGDTLLQKAAQRMRAQTRAEDTLARLGGDEFALLMMNPDGIDSVRSVAERLLDAFREPFDLAGQQISVGLSIGIALMPNDGLDADDLFKHADLALYRSKQQGRHTYRFYEPAMDAAEQERQALEAEFRAALGRNEFQLQFQPQMDVASGAIVGVEALVRWHHPTRGLISPADFIPMAEETQLIVPLGAWVLREACREVRDWPCDVRVAVNVSAVQFRQPGLYQHVVEALEEAGLPPHRLELEITESVLIHEGEALPVLHQIRELGVRIALDDFGTGYSSLSYLRRFPFDKIKIDRSFTREIENPDTAAIVSAIVGLSNRLGMSTTAEGVETEEQLDRIRRKGCTEAQGYFISRPLAPAEARAMVAGRQVLSGAA